MRVFVGLLIITFDIPSVNTLKQKRQILRRNIEKCRNKMKISIAEVDFQNRIRSTTIAVALVGNSKTTLEFLRDSVESLLVNDPEWDAVETSWELL
jgi:uncharacterized protein YlxP (DUF503 family)